MIARTLIIEDDGAYARILKRFAIEEGFDPTVVESGEEGLALLDELKPTLVLCDIGLPGMNGIEVVKRISAQDSSIISIIVSGQATLENAVASMKAGAFDIIQKSNVTGEIQMRLHRAMEAANLRRQLEYVAQRERYLEEMIGESAPMLELRRKIEEVSASPTATVLVVGETGTGKELVARAVHRMSVRSDKPLISINCAAVPENLIESEFFGHEKGAFTGADRARMGIFETARGSSLFLDEIGELDLRLQAKLLRVLEERVLKRVGGAREIEVDVRLVAATNRDLEKEVTDGKFREDLLYRVNVFRIDVPRLRDRGEDVLLLARHFLETIGKQIGKKINVIEPDAERILRKYDFPGNVRQLRNLMEQAVILAHGNRLTADLMRGIGPREKVPLDTHPLPADPISGAGLSNRIAAIAEAREKLDDAENQLIEEALARSGGNKTAAADLLGVSRFALGRRLKRTAADS